MALCMPRGRAVPSKTPWGLSPLKKHMTNFTELPKGNLQDVIAYRVHATRRML